MARSFHLADDGWLDIGSYGRHGPGRRDALSPAQVDFIARTVRGTPEVMVKMLNRGGQNVRSVGQHLRYLSRDGSVAIDTDTGDRLRGPDAEKAVIDDWDLDLDEGRQTTDLQPRVMKNPPKLVHKMVFSMPAGTPPDKVLRAVTLFAREEFGLKHRYAMVLHTDQAHPHVHLVVKSIGHDGKRLNIRHSTLRMWRREFARQLRAQGVAANATERVVRGVNRLQKTDAVYRAARRGESTHWDQRKREVAEALKPNGVVNEAGSEKLRATRRTVLEGWNEVARILTMQRREDLAKSVHQLARGMQPALTDREFIASRVQAHPRHPPITNAQPEFRLGAEDRPIGR